MSYEHKVDERELEIVTNAIVYALHSNGRREFWYYNKRIDEYRKAAARAIYQLDEYRREQILEDNWHAEV